MSTSSEDEEQVVVIDAGSGNWKAGFAGDAKVRTHFPAMVGIPQTSKVKVICQSGSNQILDSSYIGYNAQVKRDLLALHYPIEHGIVIDWDGVEKLLDYTFADLRVDASDTSVLMSKRPLNPKANDEKLTQVMFESYNIQRLSLVASSVLNLISSGRTTGMVVDVGDGVTSVTAHCYSVPVDSATQRQDFAGRDLTHVLQRILYEKGFCFSSTSELDVVRDIKEKLCVTDPGGGNGSFFRNSFSSGTDHSSSYTLPDQTVVNLSDDNWTCAEALFDPITYAGQHLKGLHQMVRDSLMNVDYDLRKSLSAQILLYGSSTLMTGLPERLEFELKKMTSSCKVIAPPERNKSAWLGGSIIGSLPAFAERSMTKGDYEEFGPSIVYRKYF